MTNLTDLNEYKKEQLIEDLSEDGKLFYSTTAVLNRALIEISKVNQDPKVLKIIVNAINEVNRVVKNV